MTAPQDTRDRFDEPKIDKLVAQLLDAEPGTISDQAGYETAVRSLARRWKISPRTLERWRWLKLGPPYLKLGGRVAYRLEDIEAYEAEQLRGKP